MANITVTHTFVNGTVADATEVNTNFSDVISGTSDGTKDMSINALTLAGALTANGNVTLGNATGDTITPTGRFAGDIDPSADNARDIGASGLAFKAVYTYDTFASLGAVGTPSYSFDGDTDTGMWSSAANILNFSAGGTEILEVDGTSIDATVDIITSTNMQAVDFTATDNFKASLGAVGTPSFTFTGDLDTGMWSSAANILNFSAGGTEILEVDGTSIDATVELKVAINDATTNAITDILRLTHNTTGTAANGIGAGLRFAAERTDGEDFSAARIAGVLADVSSGGEDMDLYFQTASNGSATLGDRMVIKSGGKIGVNQTGPTARFEVAHATTDEFTALFSASNNAYGVHVNSGATTDRPVLRCDGGSFSNVLSVRATGKVAINNSAASAALHVYGTADTGTYLQRWSDNTGDTRANLYLDGQGDAQFWLIDSANSTQVYFATDGDSYVLNQFGVGTSSPANSFEVQGGAAYFAAGAEFGTNSTNYRIDDASNGAGSSALYIGNLQITTSSDKRLKKDIEPSKVNAVDLLSKLEVVDFKWDDPSDTSFNNRNARGRWTGVLAQQVVEHIPTMVNAPRKKDLSIDHDSETTWQLDQTAVMPMLIKAIQELNAKIEKLEAA